ncbi:MAG: XRE family transcriptional regulator [Betaproteobacteria bacterium]|nr:XRE family transcriptional regulator [Betaproteobacteria bacterium]MCL2886529.1 XRE family transcriptional regulator [Betaproteobacteria bacterium]
MNQTELGAIAGVQKQAQLKYEKGERTPDADYLAAIAAAGADALYILTGQRSGHGIGESAVHQAVLDAIDLLSLESKVDAKQLARAVVKLCSRSTTGAVSTPARQVFHGPINGGVAGRDIVNKNGK